jgi:enoyl-CoA hydratase/carnithine racemase
MEQEYAVSEFETILYEEAEGVAFMTLNRPEVHNAFNDKMQKELRTVWRSLRTNDDVRAVLLTGAGEKAFCTGIDRAETITRYLEDPTGQGSTGRVSTPFMFNDPGLNINPKQNDMWKPVVTAVNGMACAGGLYLLGESDIIIAADHATFFDPHVTYGMVSGFEAVHLLQKLPLGETLRLALLGSHERMSAARACDMGLVSEVVPLDRLLERARWIANAIASAPVLAIQGTVRAIWMAHEAGRRVALAQVSTPVSLGTAYENIATGQDTFHTERIEWELR